MNDTDNWPSFSEEIGRKSLETVERWMAAHNAGKITRRELFILVSGIYDTISGLAPRDVLDTLAAIHTEIRASAKG